MAINTLLTRLFTEHTLPEAELRVTREIAAYRATRPLGPVLDIEDVASGFAATEVPDHGGDADAYIAGIFERVVPHAIHTHAPRFAGHMTSALPSFVVPLARIITALNQNVVKFETSGAFTFLERQTIAMLHRLVFDHGNTFYSEHALDRESTLGVFTSGGTVANLTALWCARNRRFAPRPGFAGIEADGLAAALEAHGVRRAVVVGSRLMHYSLGKACDILGLGSAGLVRIECLPDGQVDIDALRRRLDDSEQRRECVLAIVGVAGATETGNVDPLAVLAAEAAARAIHFHVDAAWGGPVLFSRAHRHLLAGIERADSVTIDGHKQLYLPMGIGMVLLRDPRLAAAIEKAASYIVRSGSVDLGRRSLEGSRPAQALHVHAALHILGRTGYEQLIDTGITRTKQLAKRIRERVEFELLGEPQLNIIVYRYLPERLRDLVHGGGSPSEIDALAINTLNEQIQAKQFRSGGTFASRTSLHHTRHCAAVPVTCLRLVLANPLTTDEDLEALLDEQLRIGEQAEC